MKNIDHLSYFAPIPALILFMILLFLYSRSKRNRYNFHKATVHLAYHYHRLHYREHIFQEERETGASTINLDTSVLRRPAVEMLPATSQLLKKENYPEEDVNLSKRTGEPGDGPFPLIKGLAHGAGNTLVKKETVDLLLILTKCSRFLEPLAAEKSQQMIIHGDNAYVDLNVQEIEKVITILLINAVRFSPKHTQIIIGLIPAEKEITIEVRDQGAGIQQSVGEDLFNTPVGLKRKGTLNEPTSDMGLATAKKTVEQHGGRMWFKNNWSCGCTFLFTIPNGENIAGNTRHSFTENEG